MASLNYIVSFCLFYTNKILKSSKISVKELK